LAEALWRGGKRGGGDEAFKAAMLQHIQRLDAMGWNYARYEFEANQTDEAQ
jgi:hypothetical protein